MQRLNFIFIFLSLIISLASVLAQEEIIKPVGWVNDFAQVIEPEYKEKINSLIREVEEKTSAEIVVVTMNSIAPYDEKEYARLLFDNWKPGKRGKDNGVLILLVVKDRLWRIETGYGIEGILPDGLCGEIGRNHMVPYFREKRYGEGLYYGVAAIARVIAKDAKIELKGTEELAVKKETEVIPMWVYFFMPFFFYIWNVIWPPILGVPFTLMFFFPLFFISAFLGILVLIGMIAGLMVKRYISIPAEKRRFIYPASGGYFGGSFGGGGLGGGFGGFGGGSGGGGGAGGRF